MTVNHKFSTKNSESYIKTQGCVNKMLNQFKINRSLENLKKKEFLLLVPLVLGILYQSSFQKKAFLLDQYDKLFSRRKMDKEKVKGIEE